MFDVRLAAELGFAFLILLMLASPSPACPMCKDSSVDTGKPTADAGLDFNRSIYVMLGGFTTLAGSAGLVMYRAVKSFR